MKTFDLDGVIVFAFARRLDAMKFVADGRTGEDQVAMQSADGSVSCIHASGDGRAGRGSGHADV